MYQYCKLNINDIKDQERDNKPLYNDVMEQNMVDKPSEKLEEDN